MIYKGKWYRIGFDSDRMMVTQCGNDYHDYSNDKLARIYVKWAEEHCQQKLIDEAEKGQIYVHLQNKISECVNEKWKIWKKMCDSDTEYELAMRNSDTAKIWQLENLFELQAEEIAIQTCLLA